MTCKKCKYWEETPKTDSGKCLLTQWGETKPVTPHSLAVAISYCDSKAVLLTRPDFSCNQFAHKEIKLFSLVKATGVSH